MLKEFAGKIPHVHSTAFVADSAVLIGDVVVEEGASIWYGAVLRGDFNRIVIGAKSNIQDNCVIHVDMKRPTIIGSHVTVGHGCVMEGCQIEDGAVVGMNSTVLTGATVGKQSLVGAGSLLKVNQNIPERKMAAGSPAEIKKDISGDSVWWIDNAWKEYYDLSRKYLKLNKT